jgi:thymidylate synthase
MKPGEFVHTFGDLHIYRNHLEQVRLQLSRTPRTRPQVRFRRVPEKIEEFEFEDIELLDYDPYPAIKAPVAV